MSRDLRVKKYRSVLATILAFSLAVQPAFAAGNGASGTPSEAAAEDSRSDAGETGAMVR